MPMELSSATRLSFLGRKTLSLFLLPLKMLPVELAASRSGLRRRLCRNMLFLYLTHFLFYEKEILMTTTLRHTGLVPADGFSIDKLG